MTVTVLQLSDMHFTAESGGLVSGFDPEVRLATVLTSWAALGEVADLVVLTGDNTDDGSPAGYARLASALYVIDAPLLALPGNHDDPAQVAAVFGDGVCAEVGAWRVVTLDSSRPMQIHGTVDVVAAAQLLDSLDDRPTIVAIHHPPVSNSTGLYFQLDGGPSLLTALAARPHVRALISGHLHEAFEFEGPRGLALLGCPSTIMAIAHNGDKFTVGADAPTGARILRLEDNGTFSTTLLVA